MAPLRTCWWVSVLLLALPGFVTAVLALPTGLVLLRALAGSMVGLAGALVVRDLVGARMVHPSLPSAAVGGALALLAAGGLVALVGEAQGLLLVVLVALTSPAAGRCAVLVLRARLRSLMAAAPPAVPPSSVPSWPLIRAFALGGLDDGELVEAWQQSCTALEHALDADDQLGWVLVRRALLDALERRHPVQFARWLTDDHPSDLLRWSWTPSPPSEPEV